MERQSSARSPVGRAIAGEITPLDPSLVRHIIAGSEYWAICEPFLGSTRRRRTTVHEAENIPDANSLYADQLSKARWMIPSLKRQ